MRKAKLYPPVINELKALRRQALRYYNDHDLSNRMKKIPDLDSRVYPNVDPFHDVMVRQGLVDVAFRRKWRRDVLNTMKEKIGAIDVDDYDQSLKLFNDISFKDSDEYPSPPAKLEREIETLADVINWLSEKYHINHGDGFSFNRTTSKLMRGSELIADYNVGRRKNSNPHKLLDVLFKNKVAKLSQQQIGIKTDPDKRAVEQAMHAINNAAGAHLVLRDSNRYSKIDEYYLNKELIE